ncbi:FtsX-like permease family protein [Streptomyces diastatochromogenes]|uniref:Peptide ABC transporter permease n=1 Tax=Streptomyces diastatochromogenes TaxID=42236 RepID=A0A233SWJ4_STRDA|nr:ABC transporter permease [Streptomyces diastatochromogenes]OXY99982.1 peptide ABC transporter permease [Streptomyces diastatochromogenes]
MTGFVLARARAHRLLLGSTLLTVLLTTAVLATLTAYSGAIGDAALRHVLSDPGNAAATSLIVKAEVPADGRAAADTAVRQGARRTFDGLPVTLRTLRRSGPYALPRSLQPPAERSGDPDLTFFAALDRTQVRPVAGRLPGRTGGEIEVALPQAAARPLGLKPGDRLTLADRLGEGKVRVRVTGLYRPASANAPYWQLDDLLGRGVKESGFTTYGPLLADPSVLAGGRVSAGPTAWLASADFGSVTTGRIGALRDAARTGSAALRTSHALSGVTASTTSLPDVLDRADRSLLVARSTLLIVALQLVLLAGYALLLVARLLGAERAAETRLLRARGASRARIAALAAAESLLLALPAAVCAPLLAGPLTTLLTAHGPLARLDLRLDLPPGGSPGVWLVAAAAALGCALTVTPPALTGADPERRGRRAEPGRRARRPLISRFGRGRSAGSPGSRPRARRVGAGLLPSPLRAGGDLGLLAVAAVAYWQLAQQDSGSVAADRSGALGVDPLLVAAPALALLAGTVLTLRLLPPVARLAERWAAAGRGLPMALAGWQFSRRTARAAGPVLLLVLAVALGMLAIGQASSWDRSQDDQADFRAGVPVRVLSAGDGELGRTDVYAALPHVREAVPAARAEEPLSGDRTATVLAVDIARAGDAMLMRPDLAAVPVKPLLAALTPKDSPAGARVPAHTARLRLTATLRSSAGPGTTADVTVGLEDRYGVPYQVPFGRLPADGRPHTLTLDLGSAPGPAILTALQLDMLQPAERAERHRLTLGDLTAEGTDGTRRPLALPASWTTAVHTGGAAVSTPASSPTRPRIVSTRPLTVSYGTGYLPDPGWTVATVSVQLQVARPAPPEVRAVATDRFLDSAGARTGQRVDVQIGDQSIPVRIVRAVRALPTTGAPGSHDGGAVLVDLRAANRALQARYGESVTPTEWWLRTAPGEAAQVAASVRALPDVIDPGQVVVRDEIAAELRDDPFGAGPTAAFAAAAVVAAALAAVGFAVGAAGSLRAREADFAVLRALGAPRRRLARTVAAEQAVLVGLALAVGVALGTVLARGVLPLIVLTGDATRPVPDLLVQLPPARVALLLVAVAAAPLVVAATATVRRADPAQALREQRGE